MRLVETEADGVMVVEAHGRLDSTTSKAFGDRLTSLLETGHGALGRLEEYSVYEQRGISGSAEGQPSRGGVGVQARALRGDRRGWTAVRPRRLRRRISNLPHASRWNRQVAAMSGHGPDAAHDRQDS